MLPMIAPSAGSTSALISLVRTYSESVARASAGAAPDAAFSIYRELSDSYDEELERELEDRDPGAAARTPVRSDDDAKALRRAYFVRGTCQDRALVQCRNN